MMLHRHFEKEPPKNMTKSDFSGGDKKPPEEEKPKKRKKQE